MKLKFNPFTGTFDWILNNLNEIPIGNATTYFQLDGNDLKLYVNGVLKQTWTTELAIATGNPIGLLLTLTYA